MGLKEEIEDMKNEVRAVKEQSFAMDLLKDYKKQNKRLFAIILVILSMWFITIGYLVYILNDIETEEITTTETTTQEIEDVDSIDNSYIINGDNYGKD